VALEDELTQTTKVVKPHTFKEDYELIDNDEVVTKIRINFPTEQEEIEGAKERAQEILKEISHTVEDKEDEVIKSERQLKKEAQESKEEKAPPKNKEKGDNTKKDKVNKPSGSDSPNPDNLITIKEICLDMKVDETKARRVLRKANIERPFNRWEWDKVLHKEIVDKVKKALV
jgi:ElaB/YqjD/DUF883 family membrane-anchored ribosome-binding protein